MIDEFRQGVELTQQKYFDAGIVKIWSGEQNNVSLKLDYGEETTRYHNVVFVDRSYSDAIQMLNSNFSNVKEEIVDDFIFVDTDQVVDFENDDVVITSLLLTQHGSQTHITTFPVLYDSVDYSAVREISFDGVLEPLNIRTRAIYLTSDALGNVHSCNGNVESGNVDSQKKSDIVSSVNKLMTTSAPFNDAKIVGNTIMRTVGYFTNDNVLEPFFDDRLVLNSAHDNSRDIMMTAIISLMTGSTENYINPGEYSMPTGFDYENCPVGTDSIVFGGMGY
jgi:hypothetical protein